MLEWLLKYPLDWYLTGKLGLTWSWYQYLLAVAAVIMLLLWVAGYRRLHRGTLVFAPRVLLVAVMMLSMAQPLLVVEVPEPVAGHIAVLLDDSLSMRIRDASGTSRADRLAALFGAGPESLAGKLEEKFETRYFRFGEGFRTHAPAESLNHVDARSELGGALLRVAAGHEAAALAGVVIVGDGGALPDSADRERLEAALVRLKAAEIPVQVISLGDIYPERDVALDFLRFPRRVMVRDGFDLEIGMVQRGFEGRSVRLVIEGDGIILERRTLTLPSDDEQMLLRHRLSFSEAGRRLISVRIDPLDGEILTQNNQLNRSIEVTDQPIRVLHFEGEPRFEVKFVRRAVTEDPVIRLHSLVRTADNKYYRIGIGDPSELAGGFPEDGTELFKYHVLILGSVESRLLTSGQQSAIRDFVGRRGGGLLLLGGRGAYAEGGHTGSLLAELMPVVPVEPFEPFNREIAPRLTEAGLIDPLLDFGPAEARQALFRQLPPLTVTNPLRQAKPGATVLLQGADRHGEPLILLATQRYGRGRVVSFPVRDSWRWQMHAKIPLADQTHENLWRRLLRDLGRDAGGRVRLMLQETESTPGSSVTVAAQVLNRAYGPLPQASVRLAVTTPLGEVRHLPMTPYLGEPGRYRAKFIPRETGRYDITVELMEKDEPAARAVGFLDVSGMGREFHGTAPGHGLLQRVAVETGGRLLSPATAQSLPNLMDAARSERRISRRLPLWDAPLLLLAMLALVCTEWALRRARKLA
jgi:uncharacterized membrane protein